MILLPDPDPEAPDWTDLFSGGGGASLGLRRAGHRVRVCANHWPVAVATHKANLPEVRHETAYLDGETDYRLFPRTRCLWASPSCVWHARAGGRKKPTAAEELQRKSAGAVDRATAYAVVAAAEVHRYDAIVVENVAEFAAWPLFDWWCDGLLRLGYDFQSAVICPTEVPGGVPQYRPRWFGVFTLGAGRNLDLTPPAVQTPPVAADILDPDRGKPVTRRLYVADQLEQITEPEVPHLVTYRNHARAHRADRAPLATIAASGNHHAVATLGADGRMYHRLIRRPELARAQGFPAAWTWTGRAEDVRRQIGNAVAVPVAEHIARRVGAALDPPTRTTAGKGDRVTASAA